MDQPNNYDESQNSELTDGVPHAEQNPASVSISVTTDTPDTSEQMNSPVEPESSEPAVESSEQQGDSQPSQVNDEQPVVQEQTPSENESTAEPVTTDAVAEAEQNVEAANPESINQELAEVNSEIESFVAEDTQPAEPVVISSEPDISSKDPMQQVIANEAAEQSSGMVEPTVSAPDPAVDQSVSEATQPEQTAGGEALVAEANAAMAAESAQQGQMINDVVAPSAVAAATVAGTAGLNAITGTPEASAPNASESTPPQPKKPKSKKNVLLVVMVVVIALLFGGAAVAAYVLQPADTADDSSQTEEESSDETENTTDQSDTTEEKTTAEPGQQVEAASLDDFKAACATGGKVLNASAYEGDGPHPMVVFEKGVDDKYALSVLDFTDKSWTTEPEAYTVNQLVVCIERDDATAKMLKTCPITDPTTKVTSNVDLYSTGYKVNVVEASTGTVVDTFTNNSTSTTCPTTASYNKADPKIYAELNFQALQTSLATYANAKL